MFETTTVAANRSADYAAIILRENRKNLRHCVGAEEKNTIGWLKNPKPKNHHGQNSYLQWSWIDCGLRSVVSAPQRDTHAVLSRIFS